MGYFFMLGGGLGCCGSGRCNVFSCMLGVSSLFSYMYVGFSVRTCGCLLHGFGQFWVQLCWQKSCSAIHRAVFLSFVGVLFSLEIVFVLEVILYNLGI